MYKYDMFNFFLTPSRQLSNRVTDMYKTLKQYKYTIIVHYPMIK